MQHYNAKDAFHHSQPGYCVAIMYRQGNGSSKSSCKKPGITPIFEKESSSSGQDLLLLFAQFLTQSCQFLMNAL
jgi:hypothetical protein